MNEYLELLQAGGPKPTGSNEYLDAMRTERDWSEQALRSSLATGVDAKPDQIGQRNRVAGYLGTTPAAVEAVPDEAMRAARMRQVDEATADAPITRRAYTDADFAKLAHDDAQGLSMFERVARAILGPERRAPTVGPQTAAITSREFSKLVQDTMARNPALDADAARAMLSQRYTVDNSPGGVRGWSSPPTTLSSLVSGVRSALSEGLFEQSRQGARRFAGDMLGLDTVAADAQRMNRQSLNRQFLDTPNPDGLPGDIYRGVISTAQSTPAIVAGFYSSPAALASFFAQTAAPAYSKYRDRGGSKGEAALGAGLEGLAEVLGEKIPLDYMVKRFGRAGMSEFVAGILAREIPSEIATTIAQSATDTAIANPGKTWGDFARELPEEIRQTVIGTIVQSGVFGGAGALARRMELRAQEAQQAEIRTEAIGKLNELAAASKVLERDPTSFERFAEQIQEAGPVKDLYIDANVLMQSGAAEALSQVSPSVAQQLPLAVASGGTVRIPFAEYSARVAPTDIGPALLDDLKDSPNGFSRREAQEYMQSGAAEELRSEVDRIVNEQNKDDGFRAQVDEVKAAVRAELDATKRFRPEVNDAYASLTARFFAVMGARMGVAPGELYRRFQLRVQTRMNEGEGVLNQFERTRSETWDDGTVIDFGKSPFPQLPGKVDMPTGRDIPVETTINLSDLYSTQSEITRQGLEKPRDDSYGLPLVVHSNGILYIQDGHHRLASQRFKGDVSAKVRLVDLDAKAGKSPYVQKSLNQPAYHGSPHIFDRFDLSKIGTGEGAQAYEQNTGAPRAAFNPSTNTISLTPQSDLSSFLHESGHYFLETLVTLAGEMEGRTDLTPGEREVLADVNALMKWFGITGSEGLGKGGTGTLEQSNVYLERLRAGNVPVPPGGFSPEEKRGFGELNRRGLAIVEGEGDSLYLRLGRGLWYEDANDKQRAELDSLGDSIQRFEDLDFRKASDDVFEAADAQFTDSEVAPRVYEVPLSKLGLSGYGEPNEQRRIAALAETIKSNGEIDPIFVALDESGELYIAEGQHRARALALLGYKSAPAKLIVSMESTLDQGGREGRVDNTLTPPGRTALDVWNNLDFEEKRAYHEQFARGFEAYLFEGKAPAVELHGLFQRFRAWLLSIYRELRNLNVELDDTVRGVMDRMLATTEEIKLAEQGRSMMPLFENADQTKMDPEEWAAYQSAHTDATNDATEDLQAKGLRDMQWLNNKRSREIARLKRLSAERRREVRMEVRTEVMSEPVYRAWQFLTRKLNPEDRLPSLDQTKSDPDKVDPSRDSLFKAIAKLGGINRAEVQSEWDLDPKERPQSGVFGKHVIRSTQGRSIDAMGELLVEYGYLTTDENGKWDLREFEDKFSAELRGETQHSNYVDPGVFQNLRPGEQVVNIEALQAGRLDLASLNSLGIPNEIVDHVKNLGMVAKSGLHPDVVAEQFGFTSGDDLVRTLAAAQKPRDEIEQRTDAAMLERYGELIDQQSIEREADKAIHSEARAKFVATELNALAKATGKPKVLTTAAREFARLTIDRQKVRDLRPSQYASAASRAARAAEKAMKSDDLEVAAAEKRNQLVNTYLTKSTYDAQTEVERALRYLRKFDRDVKGVDQEYLDQIDNLLERFSLKPATLKSVDRMKSLRDWIENKREEGFEPDVPPELLNEAFRTSYREMTVEQVRGLVDTVKQIEHLGRLKNKLLTAKDQRELEAAIVELTDSIALHAGDRQADTRTPTTALGQAAQKLRQFRKAHWKAAALARVLDGGNDGGPMWEYFVRSANEAGDREVTMRAQATQSLAAILAPVFKQGKMHGKGMRFDSIGRSLNREERIAIALNVGNEGNLQRLLGGEGWTLEQLAPVLRAVTADEWKAVQAIWDHFEQYRPEIAAKEKRVYGKEPNWVEPGSPAIALAQQIAPEVRGGYYPIKYDPAASQRAEQHSDAETARDMMRGAYTSATTRRSFTKARSEEVVGRPLLYSLAGLYQGTNEVIHDLTWHEWLIDTNRLMRSQRLDAAIRGKYGPETVRQFKTWIQDIAQGDKPSQDAADAALGRLRQNISAAGLGFNIVSAAMQGLGFTQSIVRVGPGWVGRGIADYIANPVRAAREVREASEFMRNRALTRWRELNELRNKVQGETAAGGAIKRGTYFLLMKVQTMVDVPTWIGAHEKALAEGDDEARAIALADQAVIDSQGGGQVKDLAAIERGGQASKLFTVFYGFMNTVFNLAGTQTMTAKSKGRLAADYLLLFTVPSVLGALLKDVLTPGGDDEPEELARKLAAEQLSYLMGTMVIVREFSAAAKIVTGAEGFRDYTGPAGVRLIADSYKLATQAHQGEFDEAFVRASVNVLGDLTGLPSAQINRTIGGINALSEGETDNPLAVLTGYQKQ